MSKGLTTAMIVTAAAAKSLQSCPTLCDPMDGSPPGRPVPGILQARTLEWVAISVSNAWKWKVKVKSLSRVWLLATSWTAAYQAPPPMGCSRQEYWSGVPSPSPYGSHREQQTLLQSHHVTYTINKCKILIRHGLRIVRLTKLTIKHAETGVSGVNSQKRVKFMLHLQLHNFRPKSNKDWGEQTLNHFSSGRAPWTVKGLIELTNLLDIVLRTPITISSLHNVKPNQKKNYLS